MLNQNFAIVIEKTGRPSADEEDDPLMGSEKAESDLVMYDLRVSDSEESDENGTITDSPQSRKKSEVECILEDIGGFGRLQMFACVVICFGMSSTGFIVNILGYLTQEPEYECTGVSKEDCTVENICSDDSRISSWKITETSL